MLSGNNIYYDVNGRHNGISCGGIGIIHQMVQKMRLPDEINSRLELLKRHILYHESDHILNIAYNILAGGRYLEEIIPDPTTEGDYLRRYEEKDVILLMDIINDVRKKIWLEQSANFRKGAILNIDGTINATSSDAVDFSFAPPLSSYCRMP